MSSSAAAAGSSRSASTPTASPTARHEHRPQPLAAAVDRVAERLAEPVAAAVCQCRAGEVGLDELAELVRRPHPPPLGAVSSDSTSFAISAQLAEHLDRRLRVLGRLELRAHRLQLRKQLLGTL